MNHQIKIIILFALLLTILFCLWVIVQTHFSFAADKVLAEKGAKK